MSSKVEQIASKVRGIAAEHRLTQQRIAEILDLSRTSVTERYQARVPFTAPEMLTLAEATGEPIERFFPGSASAADVEIQESYPVTNVDKSLGTNRRGAVTTAGAARAHTAAPATSHAGAR